MVIREFSSLCCTNIYISTTTNLMTFSGYVHRSLDNSLPVDVIYTDFEKAFDRVNHKILLRKLENFGFSSGLLRFFADYLKGRRQFVRYGSFDSCEYSTYSGVPQGSNLGPLLFLLFMNDIGEEFRSSQFLLYADDLKVFMSIRNSEDCWLLQSDLDSFHDWSERNLISLNIPKCHVLSFGRSHSPIIFNYHLGSDILSRVRSASDLGVIFSSDFSFSPHIDDICGRANRMLGFVLRNSHYLHDTGVLVVLYNSLVRSILEYCSVVWHPSHTGQCLQIERIQRRFLRYLYMRRYGYFPFLYPSNFILGSLGFFSLSFRRKVYLIKFFFSVLRGIIYLPSALKELSLLAPEHPRDLRSRSLFLPVRGRTTVFANSPLSLAVNYLNIIDCDLFNIKCVDLIHYLKFCRRI